jgi:nucleotide-binding universal stress UspA family protein
MLAARHPAWRIETETAAGSPAREILRRAREMNADLIVIGSQGCCGVNRFFLGSVSYKVANEAQCSVRVARGTAWKEGSPARLLLGFDGSAAALAAVRVVRERAWMPGSEVRVVSIVDPGEPPLSGKRSAAARKSADERDQAVRAWIGERVTEAVEELRQTQLLVTSRIEQGDPKRALVAEAEEWGADCIFIGSSGAPDGGMSDYVERPLLGSVATAVVARAGCSVEVVRVAPEGASS